MKLKEIINKSYYGTTGHISSIDAINKLEQFIAHNLPVLKEFKQIVVGTNYSSNNQNTLIQLNTQLWKTYFPNCIIIDSYVNRGHNFGTVDLDNSVFDYCKENNIEWLCKSDNDVILQSKILDKEIKEADFYYLIGISYEDLYLNSFNYEKIKDKFFPQTWFYFLNVSKCDYLNNKEYINQTYDISKTIPNYNGRIWEYIKDWSCENFLKYCVERNQLSKHYMLNNDKHNTLCNAVNLYKIGDPSHKNLIIDGVCHLQYPEQEKLEI